MSTRVDAANRAALILIGLLLLATGVLGLLLGAGVLGTDRAGTAVLPGPVRDLAADSWWFWPAVAVVCVLLALVGLRWLVAQLRTDRVGRLDLTGDERDGLTTVHAGAVNSAVEDEVEGLPGVAGASAHVRGQHAHRLQLTVDLAEHADIADVRARLEDQVVPHLRQALDDPAFGVDIELRPGKGRTGSRALA